MNKKIFDNELDELAEVFCSINDNESMKYMMQELFTSAELDDISLRWALMKLLKRGITQRQIASQLGISLCKITRGAKILKDENSIIEKKLNVFFEKSEDSNE